jgi:psp operon transcriptional activator
LSFEVLHVPPLRGRREDIAILAGHFAGRMGRELGFEATPRFTTEALQRLEAHPWPGNIRELKNVVERAVHRADGVIVDADAVDFDPFRRAGGAYPGATASSDAASIGSPGVAALPMIPSSLPDAVAALEIAALRDSLRATRHHQRKAAARLGLTYHQFRGLYRKHARMLEG